MGARDDAAKPEHLGALVEPQLAKVDGPAVVHPYRIATEQPREVQAHREVVDVGRVKKRAAERTARHQREETPARLGAADALESRGADRTGSFLVLPQEAADENPAIPAPAIGGDGRQRVQHAASGALGIVRSEHDAVVGPSSGKYTRE